MYFSFNFPVIHYNVVLEILEFSVKLFDSDEGEQVG